VVIVVIVLIRGKDSFSMKCDIVPVVPHKAVAEVSKIGNL